MSYHQRIKELINYEGSQVKFCEKTGLNPKTISKVVSTGSGVNGATIEAIALAYADFLNLEWFITGKGEMWKEGVTPDPDAFNDRPDLPDPEKEALKDEIIALQKAQIQNLKRAILDKAPELAKYLNIEGDEI